MPRRTHKKSRNGCLECKRRHVKCDEKRPICSNCTASERECEYGICFAPAPPRRARSRSQHGPRPSRRISDASSQSPSVSASPHMQTQTGTPIESQSQPHSPASGVEGAAYNDQPVNMLHVKLFHNLYTKTHATFVDPNNAVPWLPETVNEYINTPYLVNEMLAFSALHMSTQASTHKEKEYYHYHAAQLQTHALSIFKESSPEVNQDTCVPLFLFSSILGIHMLCDTLICRAPADDFNSFLTRFVHYLRLQHGVRTIVGSAWSLLHESIAAPALNSGSSLYQFSGRLDPELARLQDLINSSNLGSDLNSTYTHAIQSLQTCKDVASASSSGSDSGSDPGSEAGKMQTQTGPYAPINAVTVWPVLVGLDFGEALEMRRPEALVILAHWAVLLVWYRESWLFGDSGAFIIQSVEGVLGDGVFQEGDKGWLDWPKGVLYGR